MKRNYILVIILCLTIVIPVTVNASRVNLIEKNKQKILKEIGKKEREVNGRNLMDAASDIGGAIIGAEKIDIYTEYEIKEYTEQILLVWKLYSLQNNIAEKGLEGLIKEINTKGVDVVADNLARYSRNEDVRQAVRAYKFVKDIPKKSVNLVLRGLVKAGQR